MVDDICFDDLMYTDLPEHASGIDMMNIGHNQAIRPSLGSWLYGLGSNADNLPGYVVLSLGKVLAASRARGRTPFFPEGTPVA